MRVGVLFFWFFGCGCLVVGGVVAWFFGAREGEEGTDGGDSHHTFLTQ